MLWRDVTCSGRCCHCTGDSKPTYTICSLLTIPHYSLWTNPKALIAKNGGRTINLNTFNCFSWSLGSSQVWSVVNGSHRLFCQSQIESGTKITEANTTVPGSIDESPVVMPISQLRFDCDTTTIRRYNDTYDYDGSDRNYDLRSIRLRHDYDEKSTCSFFARVESRRMEAGARDTS